MAMTENSQYVARFDKVNAELAAQYAHSISKDRGVNQLSEDEAMTIYKRAANAAARDIASSITRSYRLDDDMKLAEMRSMLEESWATSPQRAAQLLAGYEEFGTSRPSFYSMRPTDYRHFEQPYKPPVWLQYASKYPDEPFPEPSANLRFTFDIDPDVSEYLESMFQLTKEERQRGGATIAREGITRFDLSRDRVISIARDLGLNPYVKESLNFIYATAHKQDAKKLIHAINERAVKQNEARDFLHTVNPFKSSSSPVRDSVRENRFVAWNALNNSEEFFRRYGVDIQYNDHNSFIYTDLEGNRTELSIDDLSNPFTRGYIGLAVSAAVGLVASRLPVIGPFAHATTYQRALSSLAVGGAIGASEGVTQTVEDTFDFNAAGNYLADNAKPLFDEVGKELETAEAALKLLEGTRVQFNAQERIDNFLVIAGFELAGLSAVLLGKGIATKVQQLRDAVGADGALMQLSKFLNLDVPVGATDRARANALMAAVDEVYAKHPKAFTQGPPTNAEGYIEAATRLLSGADIAAQIANQQGPKMGMRVRDMVSQSIADLNKIIHVEASPVNTGGVSKELLTQVRHYEKAIKAPVLFG